jgi:hypothetical protein
VVLTCSSPWAVGVPSRLWVMLTVRVLGSLVPPSPSATRRARLRVVVGLESALR